MPNNMDIVTLRGQTTYNPTTAVGTTTAGAYVELTVAGNSAAIFGAEVSTLSTLFSRYRIKSLGVAIGTSPTSTNRYWGVKYIPEDAGTPGVVTCLSLLSGDQSACEMSPSVRPARLQLGQKELDASGLAWREVDDATENLGTYGSLLIVTEQAGSNCFVQFSWVIQFDLMGYSGFLMNRKVAKVAAAAGSPTRLLTTLKALHKKGALLPRVKPKPLEMLSVQEEESDTETVVVREVVRARPGAKARQ